MSQQPEDSDYQLNKTTGPLTHRSTSRHRSQPKNPVTIPRHYYKNSMLLKSQKQNLTNQKAHNLTELFTFCKQNSDEKQVTAKPKRLDYVTGRRNKSTSEIKKGLIYGGRAMLGREMGVLENKQVKDEGKVISQTKLYALEFDYGKLDDSKFMTRTSSVLKATLQNSPGQSLWQPQTRKSQPSTHHKSTHASNQKLGSTLRKKKIQQSIRQQLVRSSRRVKWQKLHPQVMQINQQNLPLDKTINSNQKKVMNSRIVTMFANGRIQTKIINYPDNSQYLKICGLRK